MKALFVIISASCLSLAAQAVCFHDSQCSINEYDDISCFVVKTGTDVFGNDTCRMQCTNTETRYVCVKKSGNHLGKCKDLRLQDWTWSPEMGCGTAISMRMYERSLTH